MIREAPKKTIIVAGDGDPCPRCARPTQIREHVAVTDKQLAKPYYFSRWFVCTNADCKTTLIMAERFRVVNDQERHAQSGALEGLLL
jgi:hypothetical protein